MAIWVVYLSGPPKRKHNMILKLHVFCLKIGDVKKSHQKNWGGRSMCRDRNWHRLVTSKTSSSVKNLKSLEISEESYRRMAELVVSTYFLSPHGWFPLSVFICCMFQDSDPFRCFTFAVFFKHMLSERFQKDDNCAKKMLMNLFVATETLQEAIHAFKRHKAVASDRTPSNHALLLRNVKYPTHNTAKWVD